REPLERRLLVALSHRLRPSLNNPADLLRGLHAVKSGSTREPTQICESASQQPKTDTNTRSPARACSRATPSYLGDGATRATEPIKPQRTGSSGDALNKPDAPGTCLDSALSHPGGRRYEPR